MPSLKEILTSKIGKDGVSKTYVASELEVSEKTIENYINGKRHPKHARLLKLSQLLGFDLNELSEQNVPNSKVVNNLNGGNTPSLDTYKEKYLSVLERYMAVMEKKLLNVESNLAGIDQKLDLLEGIDQEIQGLAASNLAYQEVMVDSLARIEKKKPAQLRAQVSKKWKVLMAQYEKKDSEAPVEGR